jgi:ABC-type transport system involved in multi-copper enzyme maturation permease subunit
MFEMWKNPIVVKEIRTRMRGYRSFALLTAHLLVLGIILSIVFLVFRSATSTSSLEERRIFGKAIFGLYLWMELVTISFIAPALTAGSISTERERQTYDLLRVTLLPARSLVSGKYVSGLFFILLLLFTSIPLLSPAFLFGSVVTEEIVIGLLILIVSAVVFCAMGLFFSSIIKRTLLSTVLTYALTIFIVFGIPMIMIILVLLLNAFLNFDPSRLNIETQITLLLAGWFLICITPMTAMIGTEAILLNDQNNFWVNIKLSNDLALNLPSPWIPYIIIYTVLSILLVWLSIYRLKGTEK